MALGEIQTALNGGELSPKLYARTDLAKFEAGAALLRNWIVDFRGGVTNRPGTKFIAAVKNVAGQKRLIPFIVSTDAAYVLEFGNLYIRVYLQGVFVTEVVTPYLAGDLALLKFTQSADVLTLVHPLYPPANLSRTSDVAFSYAILSVGPGIDAPVLTTMIAPHSGPYSFGYLITAVDLDGKEESLGSNPGVKHSEGMNETTNRVIGLTWTPPAQAVSRYNVYKWGPVDAVTMNPATVWGFIGTAQTNTFTDNNIAPDFSKQPPGWGDPFSGGQIQSIVVLTGGAGYDGVSGDWPTAIPFVPLSIVGDGTGAAGYAAIDHATAKIIGAYLTNPGKNYTTATITANGQGGTGATFAVTFSDPGALNPACTAYVQQRRVFAGSDLKPETLVLSQIGRYNNFNTTPVSLATDAIPFSIAGEQVNSIKSMVGVSYGLLLFTTSEVHLLNGGSPYASITTESVSVQSQSSVGANDLQPLRVNADVLYTQNKGNRVRNLAFAWQKQAFQGSDISALAAHLFDGFITAEWTWSEEPYKLAWLVRDDGKMISLTYAPDQEVAAWCRHDTQGLFKSVCSIPEGDTNAVYVIVERHIPNSSGVPCWMQYIERLTEKANCCIFDAWYVDCGASVDRPTTTDPLYITPAGTNVVTLNTYDPCSSTPSGNFGGRGNVPSVAGIQNFDLTPLTHDNGGPAIDFDGGRLFIGDAFDGKIASYSFPGYTLLHGPVTTPDGNVGLMYDEGGDKLYGWVGATNVAILKQMDPTTFAELNSFGVASSSMPTDATHWAYPRDVDTVDVGGATYLVSTALNASQTNGQISVLALNNMGTILPVWDGVQHHTDEFLGVVCKGKQLKGFGVAWIVTQTNNLGGSISLGLYQVLISFGSSAMNKVGMIDPTKIGTGWTHSTTCPGILLDEKDGNIIAQFTTQDLAAWSAIGNYFAGDLVHSGTHDFVSKTTGNLNHLPTVGGDAFWTDLGVPGSFATEQGRIVKINVKTGAIMWGVTIVAAMVGGQLINQSRCQYGRYTWIDNLGGGSAKQHSINTITGVDTVSVTLGIISLNGQQFTEDYTGNVFVNTSYASGGNVVQIGTTPSSFTSWATLGPGPAYPAAAIPSVVGEVIQINCGKILITTQNSPTEVIGDIISPLDDLIMTDDPDGLLIPISAGAWTITAPVNALTGLDHLEGKTVVGLADGVVIGPSVVTGGSIPLPAGTTNAVAGLKYTQQIQTLYLTMDDLQPGSIQGKRKLVPAATLRLDCTKGLKVGQDFDSLTPVPDCGDIDTNFVGLNPGELFSGDAYVVFTGAWDEKGEVCIQQDDPLPASVLGIIVQVVPGDTGR